MANLIAIDWDSHELRAVTGRSGSGGLTVTDTATVPLEGGDDASIVSAALTELLGKLGVSKSKYKLLVAIGRGKAELRQLTLPPVPENELPGMVRFQALQSFSTSGDAVAVDYLPIETTEGSTSVIAAGVAPATMKQIEQIAATAGLELKRVVLRPVAAAALFSLKKRLDQQAEGDCVLVDLLADDAEIVVFRKGKLIFVRSVRMPEQTKGRTSQIAGEIRRSLMACGSDAATGVQRVVIWGQAKTHELENEQLRELLKCEVETLDPLKLVELNPRRSDYSAGEHTGRLAPLIGVLLADAAAESNDHQSAVLVDFLNPRKAAEVQDDKRLWIGIGAAAAAVVLLLGLGAWWSLKEGTAQIAARQAELNALRPQVTAAETSLARTEQIDQFLDSNVVWLDQFRRLAEKMPPADQAIVSSVSGVSLPREGGGRLTIVGAATSPAIVDGMESALRDEDHSVSGSGANDRGEKEAYRWGFRQLVTVAREPIRRQRYEAFAAAEESEAAEAAASDSDQPETEGDQSGADSAEPADNQPPATLPPDNLMVNEPAPSAPPAATVPPENRISDSEPAPQDSSQNTAEPGPAAAPQNAPEPSLPAADATEEEATQ